MELLIIMALAVGAMFLLSSRTRKQQRQAAEFRSHLTEGDEVMTASGLFGTVVAIDGDVISLESPSGARTDWLRGAIAKLATPPYAAAADDEQDEGEYDEEYAEGEYTEEEEYFDDEASYDEAEDVEQAQDLEPAPGADERPTGEAATGDAERRG